MLISICNVCDMTMLALMAYKNAKIWYKTWTILSMHVIRRAGIAEMSVCLQEELPSQDDMTVGGHNGFLPYKAVADGIAASLDGPARAAVSLLCPSRPSIC